MFSLVGLSLIGIKPNDEESIFNWWISLHKPEWLTEKGRKFVSDNLPTKGIRSIQRLKKSEFFDMLMGARREARR